MYLHGWCVNMVWMYNPTSWVQVLIDAGFSSYYIRGLPYSFIPVLLCQCCIVGVKIPYGSWFSLTPRP